MLIVRRGATPHPRIDDELFDPQGRFQTYVETNATLGGDKFDLVFLGSSSGSARARAMARPRW